jgi:hypothetical protein
MHYDSTTSSSKTFICTSNGILRKATDRHQKDKTRHSILDHHGRTSTINRFDYELCAIQRGASNERFKAETYRILNEKYELHSKIYTDRSKKDEKVGYAVRWIRKGTESRRDTWKRSNRRRSKRSTERRNSPHRNISPTGLDGMDKKKHEQEQQEKWENSTTTMKERKPHNIMNTNTKTMTRTRREPLTHWIYQSHHSSINK